MTLLILGHARHGKDTLAEIFRDNFNLSFMSSSEAAAAIFLYDKLKVKYGYSTPLQCFEDRVNHREEWFALISEYNKDDKAKLAKGILRISDCYVGMRSNEEAQECLRQGLFDLIIWVDASERVPLEPSSSFDISKDIADIIIENNGTEEEFVIKARRLGKAIFR